MKRVPRSVLAMLLLAAVAACGYDDPVDADDGEYTFVYAPSSATPAITSISVRGSFNDWSGDVLAMDQQANGTWQVSRAFDPGTYQYKYFFNGEEWASNMCDDPTWGDPANDNKVDPDVTTCVDDGFGGQNGQLVID